MFVILLFFSSFYVTCSGPIDPSDHVTSLVVALANQTHVNLDVYLELIGQLEFVLQRTLSHDSATFSKAMSVVTALRVDLRSLAVSVLNKVNRYLLDLQQIVAHQHNKLQAKYKRSLKQHQQQTTIVGELGINFTIRALEQTHVDFGTLLQMTARLNSTLQTFLGDDDVRGAECARILAQVSETLKTYKLDVVTHVHSAMLTLSTLILSELRQTSTTTTTTTTSATSQNQQEQQQSEQKLNYETQIAALRQQVLDKSEQLHALQQKMTLEQERERLRIEQLSALSGSQVWSGSADGTIRLWDLASAQCMKTLVGHSGKVSSLLVISDKWLASASCDRTIRVWSTSGGRLSSQMNKCVATLSGHEDHVWSLAAIGGSQLASGSFDHTIKVWSWTLRRCLRTLVGHEGAVHALAWLEASQKLASASYDTTIRLWNAENGECVRTLRSHRDYVFALDTMDDGVRMVSADRSGTIKIWHVASGRCVRTMPDAHTSGVLALKSFNQTTTTTTQNKWLASAGYDGSISIWNLSRAKRSNHRDDQAERRTLIGHIGAVNSLHYDAARRVLVSAGDDTNMRVWNTSTGECLLTLTGHTASVYSVVF